MAPDRPAVKEIECERHPRDYFGKNFQVERCAHFGNRFVIQIEWNGKTCPRGPAVDYVEDLPDGEVLVEEHRGADMFPVMEIKMLGDIPPQPTLSN